MSSGQIALGNIVTLFFSIPGSLIADKVMQRTNPKISIQINLVFCAVVTIIGGIVLTDESRVNLLWYFSAFLGIAIGWFYPSTAAFFSSSIPKQHQSEFTGFYMYFTVILSWLPPIIFTILNELGFHMKFGLMSMALFPLIAAGVLCTAHSWLKITEQCNQEKRDKINLETRDGNDSIEDQSVTSEYFVEVMAVGAQKETVMKVEDNMLHQ